MQRVGQKRSATKTAKTTTPSTTTTSAKRHKSTTRKGLQVKKRSPLTSAFGFSAQRAFSTKKNKNQSESESDEVSSDVPSETSPESKSESESEVERGPMMPELYLLSLQLDQRRESFYKNKKNQKDYLSLISQRMLDKNGLFLRTSPPMLHLVPSYYADLDLDDRMMYFQRGDVEVFVAPISQPDEITRNHRMVDHLLDGITKFKWDNVVIPLSAKPQSYAPYHNPMQKMTTKDIKYDVFDPENVPQPPKVISGSYAVVETPQYAAYKAYEKDYDITLSGRMEFVALNNWKFKSLQIHPTATRAELLLLLASGADNATIMASQAMNILPHTPPTSTLAEITYNFEPALVATAAIRSSIEEQQAEYDREFKVYKAVLDTEAEKAVQPRSRRILAFIDTAQLRHFENTYELMPAIKPQEWTYLKKGFEEWYRESGKPTFGDLLSDSKMGQDGGDGDDSDHTTTSDTTEVDTAKGKKGEKTASESHRILSEPGIQPTKELARERIQRYRLLVTTNPQPLAEPMVAIHRFFTAIYGPLADVNNRSCGSCQFDVDQFGLYNPRCSKPSLMSKMGLTKATCSDPFDHYFNPEALRFPPFDSDPLMGETVTPNLFQQWMALRHGLVKLEKQINKKNGGNGQEKMFLHDILNVQNSLDAILQGNLRRFPAPKVRQSDAEWSKKSQDKTNAHFIRAARNDPSDSDGDDGSDDGDKGQGDKDEGDKDEDKNHTTNLAKDSQFEMSKSKHPHANDTVETKMNSFLDAAGFKPMRDAIEAMEKEIASSKSQLSEPNLTPEQKTELEAKVKAGEDMLKRTKDAFDMIRAVNPQATKEDESTSSPAEQVVIEPKAAEPEAPTPVAQAEITTAQAPVVEQGKKKDYGNEFRNITESTTPEPTPTTPTTPVQEQPKYSGSNEFRKITENREKKD